jgi:gliding motility-associated-like protein
MSTRLFIMLLGTCLMQSMQAQAPSGFTSSTIEPGQSEAEKKAVAYFLEKHPNAKGSEYKEFIGSWRKQFAGTQPTETAQKLGTPNAPQASCTNIDFEQGSLSGWTASTGFHPGYNAAGCCASPGGAQSIVSGAGADPCGGFPMVAPGGNFSVLLGNNGTGGNADRLEQTFQVTAANTNFSYAYAVVLEDPGHAVADQPSFTIEMVDASGNPIPCTFYQVSAGQGIPGFQNSINCPGVICKPWTSVSVDLTNYINQNVTIRFTTYDCALGGHYAYAYIDGSCTSFQITQTAPLCNNSLGTLCAPAGYASYAWSGPGLVTGTGQCVQVNASGSYDVLCTSVTGCSSPLINIQVNNNPAPNANFSPSNVVGCNAFVSFNNTSSYGGGNYTNFWTFGDGDTSSQFSPSHTYPAFGTYTVSLYAYASNGCSDTTQQVVTINPPPAPGMSYTATCEGVPAQFQASLSGGNSGSPTWLWNFGNGATSTQQNPTYTFPSWGSFPVSLSVTNNGCTTTITQNVSISPAPVIAFSANSICLGTVTSFTNTSYVPGGGAMSYGWDFDGDGTIDNTGQNPGYTFGTFGTFTVSLTATSAAGCAASGTGTVAVYGLPNASFTAQNNCLNAATVYLNTSTAPAGSTITNYFWNFGDGTFSTLQQPQHTYSSPATYSVRLDVTTNHSCMASHIAPVTVFPLPLVTFTATNVCENQVTQFSGSVNGGQNAAQWSWNFGNSTSTQANPSHAFGSWGAYPVSVVATDNNGCVGSTTQQVLINPVPVISVTPNSVCGGTATNFINTSTIPSGNIAGWSWDFNSDGITDATTQSPSYTFASSGSYAVIVTATSNNGCTSVASVPVTVYGLPLANFSAANNCANAPTVFVNGSTAPPGAYLSQYAWSFGNGVSSTATSPQYTYNSAGTYQVNLTVTTNQGCTASYSAPLTIYPVPVPNFTAPNVCANQNMQFASQSTIASGNISSYFWDFNGDGNPDASTQNPVYTYQNGGSYYVELVATSNFGCRDSVIKQVTVYANPAANFYAKSVCLGTAAQFYDLSATGSGTITAWDWDFTSDNIIDNTSQNPTHTYASAGQMLVTLHVQTNLGCVNTIQKQVRVNPTPAVSFAVTQQSGCQGSLCVGMINNTSMVGGSVAMWQWQFGDGLISGQNSPVHCFNTSGSFSITLIAVSDSGCLGKYTLPSPVVVYPRPQAGFDFTNTQLDVLDASTGVVSTAVGAAGYMYFISDGTFISGHANFNHTFTSQDPGSYTVLQIVTSQHGCRDTIQKTIEVKQGFTFYIPNAFSPNGDGMNDVFKGTGIGIKDFVLMVYDRWGNLVFQSDDLEKGWDGTFKGENVVLEDVFVWKVNLKDENDKRHDFAGTVSLVK